MTIAYRLFFSTHKVPGFFFVHSSFSCRFGETLSFEMLRDFPYQLALTFVPHIGCIQAKILANHFESAENIFKAKKTELERLEGIGPIRAYSIKSFRNFSGVEKEITFIEKYKISALFLSDKNYPRRLLNCYDSPTMLFYKGNADLNHSKIISIIGTRRNSEYGKHVIEELISEIESFDVIIVSGLAFGIDAIAHRTALKNLLPTIGVLAHGLDTIYPQEHIPLAKEMIQRGGLLTEFRSHTNPDKHNFPIRNRIVAGMTDATIVIETGVKGGSMITAELANGYNKDVFAFPGRTTDSKSCGCNHLIRSNKAALITDGKQLAEWMGWVPQPDKHKKNVLQKTLFIQLTENEKKIITILEERREMHIDEINIKSNINSSAVAAAILNLELQGVINSLPGKMYTLSV